MLPAPAPRATTTGQRDQGWSRRQQEARRRKWSRRRKCHCRHYVPRRSARPSCYEVAMGLCHCVVRLCACRFAALSRLFTFDRRCVLDWSRGYPLLRSNWQVSRASTSSVFFGSTPCSSRNAYRLRALPCADVVNRRIPRACAAWHAVPPTDASLATGTRDHVLIAHLLLLSGTVEVSLAPAESLAAGNRAVSRELLRAGDVPLAGVLEARVRRASAPSGAARCADCRMRKGLPH